MFKKLNVPFNFLYEVKLDLITTEKEALYLYHPEGEVLLILSPTVPCPSIISIFTKGGLGESFQLDVQHQCQVPNTGLSQREILFPDKRDPSQKTTVPLISPDHTLAGVKREPA